MPPLYAWYSTELARRGLLPLSFDPILVAEFERGHRSALELLDEHLSGHGFLVGNVARIVDICCYGSTMEAMLG
jgi:glutathione S-transferase